MRAGLLRHLVELARPGTEYRNDFGEVIKTPPTIFIKRAAVRGLKVSEIASADKVSASLQMRFQFRYDKTVAAVDSSWVIRWRKLNYNAEAPIDPDGRGRELHIIGTLIQ